MPWDETKEAFERWYSKFSLPYPLWREVDFTNMNTYSLYVAFKAGYEAAKGKENVSE